jgi:hypothetical protein
MNPPSHPPSVCPSTNLSSFHLPHTETRQWGPHPSSIFPTFLPSLGHSFHNGAPVSVFCTSFPILFHYFLYKHLLLPVFAFVVTAGDLLSFWLHATHVTLGWSITSHLPSPTSSISSEHYPGHLPLSSKFVHLVLSLAQLISDLVVPPTLDLVTWLRPRLLSCILQPRVVLILPTS